MTRKRDPLEFQKRNERSFREFGVSYSTQRRLIRQANESGIKRENIKSSMVAAKGSNVDVKQHFDTIIKGRSASIAAKQRGGKAPSTWRDLADDLILEQEDWEALFWYK